MPTDRANASTAPADSLGALLTAGELAKKFKVKPSYLQWLRHRHALPYVRIGGEVRFSQRAVSAWLEQRAKSRGLIGRQP
jgi:excisionase family DNA binding protein